MLDQIRRNQPVPLRRFIVGTSIMTGLKEETVAGYVKQFPGSRPSPVERERGDTARRGN